MFDDDIVSENYAIIINPRCGAVDNTGEAANSKTNISYGILDN